MDSPVAPVSQEIQDNQATRVLLEDRDRKEIRDRMDRQDSTDCRDRKDRQELKVTQAQQDSPVCPVHRARTVLPEQTPPTQASTSLDTVRHRPYRNVR